MSNKAPIDVYTRVRDEAALYRDAYVVALSKGNELSKTWDAPEAVAARAVRDYRKWLVDQGYVDLDEGTD